MEMWWDALADVKSQVNQSQNRRLLGAFRLSIEVPECKSSTRTTASPPKVSGQHCPRAARCLYYPRCPRRQGFCFFFMEQYGVQSTDTLVANYGYWYTTYFCGCYRLTAPKIPYAVRAKGTVASSRRPKPKIRTEGGEEEMAGEDSPSPGSRRQGQSFPGRRSLPLDAFTHLV
ncbi:uncharacterized protein BDZ83DRAFT_307315 [Colletotrichum acutatum]|uniref:Uncharacterized protein n=1 Tax=Glomerella acutata TaxID=27357 RepID=A0AAD8XFI0_GLOAC|nr:uncharacterized protein BDZ83DRAFT_307315 [Colletotrichum acutatum]KAK1725412.1 hypothetical protein BDZ83DRAFT_307315 [Colletotrichum acutatum]